MAPPIVQIAFVYGASLWVGLVFLLPAAAIWSFLVVSLAAVTRTRWVGILMLAASIGAATGGVLGHSEAKECSNRWSQGKQVVMLQMFDRASSKGVARASVVHSLYGCRGSLRLRIDSTVARPPGGARLVAIGTYRGAGVLRVTHVRVFAGGRAWRFAMRDAVAERIAGLYGDRAGLVEAIILGRREDIGQSVREQFARAGLAHLLAISGLHVGVLAGWCLVVARVLGARRRAWFWSGCVVWVYVASLGFPAPATRAAAFLSILSIARIRQRHPPPNAVLSVAILIVLAIDPSAATSVGAWMSAAAVWGTRSGIQACGKFRLLGASLGATLATAPITAFVFGTVAPIGIVANLAAVPLAGIAVPGLFFSLLFGGFLAGGTGLVMAAIEWVARLGAGVPGGNIVGVAGAQFAAPWVLMLFIAVWITRTRPAWVVVRRRLLMGTAGVCWSMVALSIAGSHYGTGDLVLNVLSVGQGDAIVIRTPHGHTLLVDGGPRTSNFDAGQRIVVPFLRKQGVTKLDAVVVSHGDADHLGGIPSVIRELKPEIVLDPGQSLGTELYLEYLRSLDVAGSDWRPARRGDSFTIDSVKFEVLHPSSQWMNRSIEPNENSVVLHMQYRCFTALLTGDIGWPAESALVDLVGPSSVLKVAHHGSNGSSSQAWVDAVSPTMAVISVGKNRFGHPDVSVLERFEAGGIPVLRTDHGGTVTIRSDGSYFESIQGNASTFSEVIQWLIRPLLRSSGSSSNRRRNIPTQRVNLPDC